MNTKKISIKVENLSKTFCIPHDKTTTLKGAALGMFSKKSYTKFKALENVNFEVKKGEFFGIIGRNGSGKSTLLKVLAGIYVSDKGEGKVTISGKLSPFLELGVGFNQELTGRENLFLGGAILGLSRQEVSDKLDKIVAFSELEEFIDMKLKNYSSGMQVRLAFSLAINAHAEILLMDEVLAVGDTNFQGKCLEEFSRYKKEGKTVVLVSHDTGTIQRYCDRAMLLRDGSVIKVGVAKEIVDIYLTQNMRDIENKNNEGEQTSEIKKKTYITNVVYLDQKNKTKSAFKTGDNIKVRVYFNKQTDLKKINFGLALFSQENNYILGVNTFDDKIETVMSSKRGYFEIIYNNIPLKKNVYYVKAGLWGENINKPLDLQDSSASFKIYSNDNNEGMVSINYEWR